MFKTMRLRLIAAFVLVVLITIASMVLITRQVTAQQVRTFMFRGGLTGTESLVTALEDYYDRQDTWVGVENLFAGTGGGHGRSGAQGQGNMGPGMMMSQQLQLADASGTILYDSHGEHIGANLNARELAAAVDLQVDGVTVGYLLAEGGMAFSTEMATALLTRLNQAAVTAALIAGGAALLLALLLAYSLLRPVGELRRAAGELAAGDLSQRVPVRGGDELARLAESFNLMASSLQQAQESRQALTADIAHELRTPLAVQRAHLEALQDGLYDLTPANLSPIEAQNHLLTRLVEDLRTLALADSGALALVRTPTDLPALIERITARFAPQAVEQQIELRLVPQPLPAMPLLALDAQRVEQILNNLFSNALRHTPPGGLIQVSLSFQSERVQVQVRDSGPGIPPESLPFVFERFYRADKARDRLGGGTGLGLSIARKLAQAHGGDLQAANHPEGGAVFTLVMELGS
ncbi:MAG: HAMP domain-containing protein [Anaerolineales bacterium]|nr:HAMP domain-containing protein [Anaerolineales bacterium]